MCLTSGSDRLKIILHVSLGKVAENLDSATKVITEIKAIYNTKTLPQRNISNFLLTKRVLVLSNY